jgi:ubiquinone/menaquinone biosynthesis C-methylase UbiE
MENSMAAARGRKPKPYKGIAMEGILANWYARSTAKNINEFTKTAERIAAQLRPGDHVLEIAPGPGYLAIELARLGSYRITGIDISRSFVRIAAENAARAGVAVTFRLGDAAALPLATDSCDFVVCRAAFKNFGDPIGALREIHRVLRREKTAWIIDMRSDASDQQISDEVAKMNLGRIDALFTRAALSSLRKRAYSHGEFERMIAATPFGRADIVDGPIGFEITLRK